jgi:hypothetical protein
MSPNSSPLCGNATGSYPDRPCLQYREHVGPHENYLQKWYDPDPRSETEALKAQVAKLEAQLARAVPVVVVSDSIFASFTTKPKNLDELLGALGDESDSQCGDYPAPCNCDDPETHNGHTTPVELPPEWTI